LINLTADQIYGKVSLKQSLTKIIRYYKPTEVTKSEIDIPLLLKKSAITKQKYQDLY